MRLWFVWVAAAAGACGGGGAGDAGVDAPSRPLAIERVVDLGRFPEPSATVVGRDGGPGGALGGRLLWTFGDTFLGARNPVDNSNVLSATAGWSAPDAPLALVQPVDAGGFPAQFIPYTAAELAQNQAAPLDGWGLWPGMMIDTGAAEGLVVFQRIKRTAGSGFDSQGVGTARIAVDATVATRIAGDLFAPPEPLFLPQSVIDGQVYAVACAPAFLSVDCKLARAPVAEAGNRAAYQFFDGAAWQPDVTRAAVVLTGGGGVPTLSWNPWLGQYLAITGRPLDSAVQLRTADRIEGPWSAPTELPASADGSTGLYAPTGADAYNYAIVEHTALRSADGRSIVISYSRPTEAFRGDVRLARVTLR
jgi:hypothetical protein